MRPARPTFPGLPPSMASSTPRSAVISRQLLEAAEPDVVLNAVVGFAGRRGDPVGARARGHARAREQGEPRRRRRARARREGAGRRTAAAGRLRALGRLPVPRRAQARIGRLARADRLGRAFPRPLARRARRRRCRGCARAPDLEHGPEDHDRLGHAREQGARADRGAFPLRRSLREHRGRRASELDRPLARPLPRRRRARTSRLPGHDRADLVRADLPGARGDRGPAARPGERADARVLRPRPRDVPAARTRTACRRARRHVPVRLQRRERGRGRCIPGREAAVPRHRRGRRGSACRGGRKPGARSRRAGRGRCRGPPCSPSAECPSHEHVRLHPRAGLPDPDPRGRPLLRRPSRRG